MKKMILVLAGLACALCFTGCLEDEKAALKCEFGNCKDLENKVAKDVCDDLPYDPHFSKADCLKAAKEGARMGTKLW